MAEVKTAQAAVPSSERSPLDWAALLTANFFGVGKLPVAPGTWGSLAAAALYWAFLWKLSTPLLALLTVVISAAGIAGATRAERVLGKHDPGEVVIDEVAGQLVSLLIVHHLGLVTLPVLIVSFLAFRAFDILKPFPCYQLQSLPAGWGVMCDDLFAGVYAAIVTYGAALVLR